MSPETPMRPDPRAARPAAVAGSFYPGDPAALRAAVRAMLAEAPPPAGPAPKALIAPHAGYVYSGPTAARAYATVAPLRGKVSRVVLLGPVHRVPVRGLALPGVDRFETPLGSIEVDREAVAAIRGMPQVVESARAHEREHSLEVQLPFLQEALGTFTLVPLAVGDATPEDVSAVLARLWGGDETLVVVSSDLSHYLPYRTARAKDEATVAAVLSLEPTLDPEMACGAAPVNGLLHRARALGLRPALLDLRSSGDTAGDRDQVVGYGAIGFFAPAREGATDDRGPLLLAHARAAIASALGASPTAPPDAPFLHAPGATFVTLKRDGALRGCVGSVTARAAMLEDLRENARAAALEDPRFSPVSPDELGALRVEVSVLSPSTPMTFADEADLCAQLRPGLDGLVLQLGSRRATFLPQVWEDVPDARDFVRHLKRKMGLAADSWSPEMRAERYGVEKWSEREGP